MRISVYINYPSIDFIKKYSLHWYHLLSNNEIPFSVQGREFLDEINQTKTRWIISIKSYVEQDSLLYITSFKSAFKSD